ncbi:MAG TPA: hypothetical protein VKM55_19095 [Candidatus Lokiarchaeia archaeon]|nr:hypothetical protein [Candidatus Lokiarchaeia archaeon]
MVGCALPNVMQCLIKYDPGMVKAFASLAKSAGVADWKDAENPAASKLLKAVQDLQKKIEFPTNLSD